MGDAAVKILILVGDFFEVEGGCEASVVDVFGLSHRNIFSIFPLKKTHTDRWGVSRSCVRVNCLAQGHNSALNHTDSRAHPHTLSLPLCYTNSTFEGHDYNSSIMKSAAIKLLIVSAGKMYGLECVWVCVNVYNVYLKYYFLRVPQ